MKAAALLRLKSGKSYLKSKSGSHLVPDFDNPHLLTWLFPHLDPWGIGGFSHASRARPISLKQQLRYLLLLENSPFARDPNFAFVYYNILQKKEISQGVSFKISVGRHADVVKSLLAVDNNELSMLTRKIERDHNYRGSTESEKSMFRLLSQVEMFTPSFPGNTSYKIARRNEIRGLIMSKGCPALFLTLNPSDIDHPLRRLFANDEIDLEADIPGVALDYFQSANKCAKQPDSAALFFDKIISEFIHWHTILRFNRKENGLFGKCVAYYGMVEAQGKGTLHCHMLIWLEGHLSPLDMRERMKIDEGYKCRVIEWLESIIKCELLGSTTR
jgi:hypothetical protein